MLKPVRPKYYYLAHAIFWCAFIIATAFLTSMLKRYFPDLALLGAYVFMSPILVYISPRIYGNYKAKKSEFEFAESKEREESQNRLREEAELKRLKQSKVNENIQRYKNEREKLKLNAKWWHFWC